MATRVNQAGQPIIEEVLFASWTKTEDPEHIAEAISLLCAHLKVEIVRTNATKHGYPHTILRNE